MSLKRKSDQSLHSRLIYIVMEWCVMKSCLEPFSTLNNVDVKKVVLAGERPLIPTDCPQRVKSMIEACWK